MQNHTGVKISTPAAPSKSAVAAAIAAGETPSKVKIGLAGLREQVTECRFLIKELIKYYHTAVTHPGVVHEEVDIPASYYNYVIGSKGAEIKHIQGNYSVSVHIPNSDSQCENILVVGQPEKVAQASAHIRKLVEKVDALNEKRAAEQAAREAEAAQRAANAAAAREARAAAAAAARGENVAGNAAPVAYSIGGGSNLAVDKSMRRRKNDEDERVPGDEWMDNFAPPSKGTSIMAMLPSKFTGKEGAAAAGEGEKSSADAETAAPATEAAAATTAAAEQKHSDTPAMEFPTPAEVLGRAGAGGAKPATAAAATASASMPAATGESSELEDGEVPESAAVAAAPAVPPGVWNKH